MTQRDPVAGTPHADQRDAMRSLEQELAQAFESDAATELLLADETSALLALVMSSVGERTSTVLVDDDGKPTHGADALQLYALQIMGARALRVIRAAQATLRYGYEPESRAQDRVLVELLEHRSAVLNDPTGSAALAWLRGERRRGVSRRVAAMSPPDLYKNLCHDSHGDPVPVARLMDHESATIKLEPRRTLATRASLVMHAGFARDQAVAIAVAAGIRLANLEQLDGQINAAWGRLEAEYEEGS